jgi:predicted GNAT family acetyltransferase
MGFPGELFDKLYEASKPILDASILLTLYYRREISEQEFRDEMRKHGWDDDKIDRIVKASLYYPSPSDIVRFAVREVFTPEIAEKYGLAEDMPKEYLEMARRAGLSEEFAKWYWMAHWELPSISMGFEMFHRGIISREELETLLRVLDVMPYWRDKLIELSYELPTRVDVRRMYSVGVIDDKQLYEYYLKMGYSPEDAERLTVWTRKEYLEDERVLTKSQIKELYIIGELSLEEASRMLQDLGYSEEEVGFITTLWNHEKLNQMQKEAIEYLLELYKNGIITYEQLSDELNKLNLKATTLDIILLKARRMRVMSEKLPSESKIISWYKRKIISRDEFVSFMRRLGYSDQIIGYYLREMRE